MGEPFSSSPTVWAHWRRWKGPPELVAHIADVAMRSASAPHPPGTATLRADIAVPSILRQSPGGGIPAQAVHVLDHEFAESPTGLRDDISMSAYRRFERVEVDVHGSSLHARITWVAESRLIVRSDSVSTGPAVVVALPTLIRELWHAWTSGTAVYGVSVLVSDDRGERSAREQLDRISAAVARSTGDAPRLEGSAPTLEEADAAIEAHFSTERNWRRLVVLTLLTLGFAVGIAGYVVGVLFDRIDLSDIVSGNDRGSMVVIGSIFLAFTLLITPAVQWLWFRVEINAATRAQRAASLLYKSVIATLVSAVLGVGVRQLFGG